MRPTALHLAVAALLVVAGVGPVAAGGGAAATTPDARPELTGTALGAPNVTVWIAPENDTFADGSAIERAVEAAPSDGPTLTRSGVVAANDTLAVRVVAAGLDDLVAAQSGQNLTERFVAAVRARESFSLSGVQTQATTPPSQLQKELELLGSGGVTVYRTDPEDTYWLVYDTARLTAERGEDRVRPEQGEGYEFRAETDAGTDAGRVRIDNREAVFWRSGEATIAHQLPTTGLGLTSLAPGTDVVVTVRADGEVIDTGEATVQRGGGAPFEFRFSVPATSVRPGETFSIGVTESGDGPALSPPLNVTVRDPDAELEVLEAQIALDEDRGFVRARTNVSTGGFLVVREPTDDGGEVLGVADLPHGEDVVTVSFDSGPQDRLVVVAYRDADLDGQFEPEVDVPYMDSPMATVSERIELQRSNQRTSTISDPTTPPPTDSFTTTATTRDYTPDRRVPGFGVGTALACLALLAGLGLGWRRRP